jgi:hypothetical protein
VVNLGNFYRLSLPPEDLPNTCREPAIVSAAVGLLPGSPGEKNVSPRCDPQTLVLALRSINFEARRLDSQSLPEFQLLSLTWKKIILTSSRLQNFAVFSIELLESNHGRLLSASNYDFYSLFTIPFLLETFTLCSLPISRRTSVYFYPFGVRSPTGRRPFEGRGRMLRC